MEDIWIDAIYQYIRGEEWLKVVKNFVDQHCAFFSGGEYSVGQHGIFLEFRQIAERVIGSLLEKLGCTEQQFIEVLEMKVKEISSGPKDAEIKTILQTLLEMDDFEGFCRRMEKRNRELEEQELDELAQKKNQESFCAISGKDGRMSPMPIFVGDDKAAPKTSLKKQKADCSKCSDSESEEDSNESCSDEDSLPPEWDVQVAAAMSVLEGRYKNTLTDEQTMLLPWAQAVMSARDEMNREGVSRDRVHELEKMVMDMKFQTDLILWNKKAALAASRWMIDEYEGANQEELMAALIAMSDRLRNEVAKARSRTLYHEGISLNQESLESLYLFLKEKVQNDLVEKHAPAIQDLIKSNVTTKEEGAIESLLLWLHLEKQTSLLEKKIYNGLSGQSMRSMKTQKSRVMEDEEKNFAECWEEQLDPTSGHVYYVNLTSGESSWEPPEVGYKPLDLSQVADYEGWVWNDSSQEWECTSNSSAICGDSSKVELDIDNEEKRDVATAYNTEINDAHAQLKCLTKVISASALELDIGEIYLDSPSKSPAKVPSSPGPPLGMPPGRKRLIPPVKSLIPVLKGQHSAISRFLPSMKFNAAVSPEEDKPLTSRSTTLTDGAFRYLISTNQSLTLQNKGGDL